MSHTKKVGEKRNTIGTHKNTECLLKNTSIYMLSINLMILVTENALIESECFHFTKKDLFVPKTYREQYPEEKRQKDKQRYTPQRKLKIEQHMNPTKNRG